MENLVLENIRNRRSVRAYKRADQSEFRGVRGQDGNDGGQNDVAPDYGQGFVFAHRG